MMTGIAIDVATRVTSTEHPQKRRKSCPICASEELIALDGTFFEKAIDRFIGLRKYRCFMCGHVFEAKRSKHSRSRAREAAD